MATTDHTLTCTVNMQWLNAQGTVQRKVSYKTAVLKMLRNDFRDMFIEITADKNAPIKLQAKNIRVHNKFMNEGKASIQFEQVKCTLLISNAPPAQLLGFLRTMFVKITEDKAEGGKKLNTSLRTQLLSNKPAQYEEISPVTLSDLDKAKQKVSKTSDTTPSPGSRKRKLNGEKTDSPKLPPSKKLYSSSPILNEPLNIEQQEVMNACMSGRNLFFTGSAGTGKSYLLKKIIGALPPDVTVATASTGVAACHIGGITLHQFAGIGGGEATLERCYDMAMKAVAATVWRKCKHLIVDEISMIDGEYFEKIEKVARHVRKNDKPFGGIQLILCGDFLQLPPVVRQTGSSSQGAKRKTPVFCFQTEAWNRCVHLTYELKRVHRQNDLDFIDILNNIRVGKITDEVIQKLTATSAQRIEESGILATRLCSHTEDANIINSSKLSKLSGDEKVYIAKDSSEYSSKQLDQQTPVPSRLVLKIGAQVMLMKNIDIAKGLVNGARGVVISFKEGLPVVRFRGHKDYVAKEERWVVKSSAAGSILTRIQVPLKLAWAFSIHKSQGLTLDCVEMSLSRVFEAGQAYVALSRAKSLETLRVLDFNPKQIWANPDVLMFYREVSENSEENRFIPLGKKSVLQINKPKIGGKSLLKSTSSTSLLKKLASKPLMTIS